MNSQQLHDLIIKPTLEYMSGNYNTESARLLLLATAAIESDCGYYIKQANGPALGIWQMEPATHDDIWVNCDYLKINANEKHINKLFIDIDDTSNIEIISPMYACAMARLKYSMDSEPLPKIIGDRKTDEISFWHYYKRIYNTQAGASTFPKWQIAIKEHSIFEVTL